MKSACNCSLKLMTSAFELQGDGMEGSDTYMEKLIYSLKKHPRPQKRKEVAWMLGEKKEKVAVAALIESLDSDPDIFVRAAAAEALGKIGSRKAISILEHASIHDMVPVRKRAEEALKAISETSRSRTN
ncbi:MAG TPA: HEAT repeat domain-containing protein [Euryarchaeota archaeon]|nr:PBS lyase HEAT-like repeat protein [archaeon BMS3Bbin15]HDL14712.1 HEAT repeat domain-containing protein [Euryarchaeota archaeon]